MAFYKCLKCNWIFSRIGTVDECPYCEHVNIIISTEKEAGEFVKRLDKPDKDERSIIGKERG